jgi:hypothetical protein
MFHNVAALKIRNNRYRVIAAAVIAEGCCPFLNTDSLFCHLLEKAVLNRKSTRDTVEYATRVVIKRNTPIASTELGGIMTAINASANQDTNPITKNVFIKPVI